MIDIREIQGTELESPLAGQVVRTSGVVTGCSRRGFFIQSARASGAPRASSGLFVFGHDHNVNVGSTVEVEGKVVDFVREENDRPTTQLVLHNWLELERRGPTIEPVWLTAANLPADTSLLGLFLNTLEGMLVGIGADATFIAPSNPFGDYVLAPADSGPERRSATGGMVIDPGSPERWYPSCRIIDYAVAPQVNVGARLLKPVTGPLNYRAGSYQIAVQGPIAVEAAEVAVEKTTLLPDGDAVTVMTLNGFNLDVKVEDPARTEDSHRDVDDDVGDGRFRSLARAVVEQAGAPDIIALQEIQDNDGAEISGVVDASQTYQLLIDGIRMVNGPSYDWIDLPPQANADGGQPGGNIRNGFLYNPARVTLVEGSPCRLGEDDPAYQGARHPLAAKFVVLSSGAVLTVVNVHLASKRHQHGIFSPQDPGYDPRQETRVRQAEIVRGLLMELAREHGDYYVTGDFNDFEFSETLAAMTGDESVNLVESLPPLERYDYNHRGKLEALMHGLVSRRQAEQGRSEYAILHGNELIGVEPGDLGSKPTDHAYVVARLLVQGS